MKKYYKNPTMKVRTIECSHIICGSDTLGVNSEKVSKESAYSSSSGYSVAW